MQISPELNGALGAHHDGERGRVRGGVDLRENQGSAESCQGVGVKLGRHGAEVLAPKYREEACQRAKEIEPIIRELQEKGYSRNRIAMELNKRKVPTPRCGRWDHSSVRNVMRRLAA